MLSLPFTPALTHILERAPGIARSVSHNTVGPEHLLRSLILSETANAARLFRDSDADPARVWEETWPEGVRLPKAEPPLTPMAETVITFAVAQARLRAASHVSTCDLLRVLAATDSPGIAEFFTACRMDPGVIKSGEARDSAFQSSCLRARFANPEIAPLPGVISGRLPWEPYFPIPVTDADGSVAAVVAAASGISHQGTVSSIDLLRAVQAVERLPHYPVEQILRESAALPATERGAYPFDLNGAPVLLTREAAFALYIALLVRDCYGIPFVRGEHLLLGLLVSGKSAVRLAFERTLLFGLTTTRDHIDLVVGMRFADLPAVLRAIATSFLRAEPREPRPRDVVVALDPGSRDVLVALDSESWESSDSDPLLVVDHLFHVLSKSAETAGDIGPALFIDQADAGLGEGGGGAGFRRTALQAMALAALVVGDSGRLSETIRRLCSVAAEDGCVRQLERLHAWAEHLPGCRDLAERFPLDSPAEANVKSILRAVSPADVVRRMRALRAMPTEHLIARVDEACQSGSGDASGFARLGGVAATLRHIADEGLDCAAAAAYSPRVEGRIAAMRPIEDAEFLSADDFGSMIKDSWAKSGLKEAPALIDRLQSAAAPISADLYNETALNLRARATQALGSDYEAPYLRLLVMCDILVAERVSSPAEANEAIEAAMDALKLLAVEGMYDPDANVACAALAKTWSHSAAALAARPVHVAEADLMAIRTAVQASASPRDLNAVLSPLAQARTELSAGWITALAEGLGRPDVVVPDIQLSYRHAFGGAEQGHALQTGLAAYNESVEEFLRSATADSLLAMEATTSSLLRSGLLSADGEALVVARVCGCFARSARQLAGFPEAAERIVAMASAVAERMHEPGPSWTRFYRCWTDVASLLPGNTARIAAHESALAILGRGYRDARSHRERNARATELRLTASSLAIALVENGRVEDAAIALESTADLARWDRRRAWEPRALAQSTRQLAEGPHRPWVPMNADPYALAFIRSASKEPMPPDWYSSQRSAAVANVRSAGHAALVLVPGKEAGAIIASADGEWVGWSAPGLSARSAEEIVLSVLGNPSEPGRAVELLRAAIPGGCLDWIRRHEHVRLIARDWLDLVPVHAALLSLLCGPESRQSPTVFSHSTSYGAITEAEGSKPSDGWMPVQALIVANPSPGSMPRLRHADWEFDSLCKAAVASTVVQGIEASHVRVADALNRGVDVFHFAGHAMPIGLILAYDTSISISDILMMKIAPPRLAVLSGCQTAVPQLAAGASGEGFGDSDASMLSAFQDTWCPGVIGNLWNVNDLAAALVMDFFYRIFDEESWERPAECLQRAVLWLRSATRAECAARLKELRTTGVAVPAIADHQLPVGEHPFSNADYWAPFIFYGA